MTVESEALADILGDEDLATSVTYARGAESADFSAVGFDDERMAFDDNGLTTRAFIRIWQILVSELPFGLPVRGDFIIWGGISYEVLPHGSEPEWRYLGAGRTAIEVLTKQTSGS